MDRLLTLKKELQASFEILKKEHEELKNSNEEYASEIDTLMEKLSERDKELDNLKNVKSDLDSLLHKHHNLDRIHGVLRENAEKFQEENQELHEEVFKLQEKIAKLEHDVEIAGNRHTEMMPKEKYQQLIEELNDYKTKRKSVNVALDEINIDDNAKSVIENLKRELNDLKDKCKEDKEGYKCTLYFSKFMSLYNKYVDFDLGIESETPAPNEDSEIPFMKQLETIFKSLQSFKKQIDAQEHNLSENSLTINNLKTQIEDLSAENDFLSSDLHHLEKELEEMRKNNDFLINEIAALKNTSKLQPIVETQEDNIAKLETELADCNKLNESFESELQKVTRELNEMNSEKLKLEKNFLDLNQKYFSMAQDIDSCKKTELQNSANIKLETNETSDFTQLRNQLSALKTKNEQLLIDVSVVENDKILLIKEIDDLKRTLSEQTEGLNSLQSQNNILLKEIQSYKKMHENLNTSNLKTELIGLRQKGIELKNYLMNNAEEFENMKTVLGQALKDLHNEFSTQEVLNATIHSLEAKIQQLDQTKNHLELEVNSYEKKVDEATALLKDKNVTIETLNKTLCEYKEEILQLNKTISKLKNDFEIKDSESFNLTQSLSECLVKIEDMQKVNQSYYSEKKNEISLLESHIEELKKKCHDYETLIFSKEKEVAELRESVAKKLENNNNSDMCNKLSNEKSILENQIKQFEENLRKAENEISLLKSKLEETERSHDAIRAALDESSNEKAELINLINLKHNESTQYHNEIQRLNQVLMQQAAELKKAIEERDLVSQQISSSCNDCIALKNSLKEKEASCENLKFIADQRGKLEGDLTVANETIRILKERCENLDKNLTIQLEMVKNLSAENAQLTEKEQNSARELERLRLHLVELEDNYTQELMVSEQKLAECQTRLNQVEERAKQNSTVYTSNSIRANQEVETLRNQIKLVEKQRDDVQIKLGEADDARSKSEAALTNLQVVLEQFQLDKERDIQAATEKIGRQLQEAKSVNEALTSEVKRLSLKLEEALSGLRAASRLGDQLETKTAQINDLKEQVRTLQTSVAAAEDRYYKAITNQQDKVDKELVKNLVLNYVTAATRSNINRTQVLRILSTVLDFNQKECETLGLTRTSQTGDSLAAEFVKFLQYESTPRAARPTPRQPENASRKSSVSGPNPPMNFVTHVRNPSTGSNNILLQNLEASETSSQLSIESDKEPRRLETGVMQARSSEGAILKHVLRDM